MEEIQCDHNHKGDNNFHHCSSQEKSIDGESLSFESIHKRTIPLLSFPTKIPITITVACNDPPVFLIDGFLTEQECKWLRDTAEPMFRPSTAVEDNKLVIRNYRTSWTAHLTLSGKESNEPILQSIMARVSAFSGKPISHMESINVVRYRYGEKYEEHHDYFGIKHSNIKSKGGERIMTFFAYLNDIPEDSGGATLFPMLNFDIIPKMGACAFWLNTDQNATIYYEKTLHAGEEIKKENIIKYGMNIWIRQYPMV
jgi:hypothetical protein